MITVGRPVQLGRLRTAAGITIVAGQPGLSAYQLAVVDGFDGTEAEWLESLVGPEGAGVGSIGDVPGLQDALDDEAEARAAADAALDDRVQGLEDADFTDFVTDDELDDAIDAHASDTTGIHGIADTSALILEGDARLTNPRTPTTHTHPQSDVTGLTADLAAKADLVAGKIPTAQLPTLAVNETFPAANEAAMLALTAEIGDVAIRSDIGQRFLLVELPATDVDNWVSLEGGGSVTSVAGKTGVVSLVVSDIGGLSTDLAGKEPLKGSDDNFVTDAEKAALHTHPAVIAQGATQADARTAIGLGTAATHAHGDYATAAQGTKADSALQAADITGKLDTSAAPELIRDTMGTALVAGTNVTITPNDGADTITIAASGGSSYTDEQVRDVIAAALTAGSGITITPNDASDIITIAASGGGGGGTVLIDYGGSVPGGTPSGTIVFEKALPTTVYDFTLGSLPAGWASHGTASATFSGSGMACTVSAAGGWHLTPAALPAEFTLELWILTQASVASKMFGPHITDASGNGAQANWYDAPNAALGIGLNAYAYSGSFAQVGAGPPVYPTRLRLRRTLTASYASYSSDGGATWSAETAAITLPTSISRIGFGSGLGSATATVQRAIITAPSTSLYMGRAKGWWDGSAIQPLA